MPDLIIKNVDFDMLENQRKTLNTVLNRLLVSDFITLEEGEDLQGVANMLDAWSDERYFAKGGGGCPKCGGELERRSSISVCSECDYWEE